MNLAIILTLIASLFHLSENPIGSEIIQRLEAIPYDIRLKLSIPKKINDIPPIIIIDIDEKSLKREGRWPWSRKKLAHLIDKLAQNDTALIMLDIVQSEKEINPVKKLEKVLLEIKEPLPSWFPQVEKKLDADTLFSDTIKGKEVILGFPFHSKLTSRTGELQKTSIETDVDNISSLTTLNMKGYTANLKQFSNNALGSGFINITSSIDGVVRHAPIITSFNNEVYPSLALETARLYLLGDQIKLHTAAINDVRTVTHLSLGKMNIPTDAQGRILIPYLGKQKHFTYLSATDLLHSKKPFPELENAIAIIGTSAIALADLRSTPVEADFPGIEIQANILHGILHPQSIAYTPDWSDGAIIVLLIFICLLMILIYPMLQPLGLIFSGIIILFLMFSFNYWLWASLHIHLPIVMPLLLIMAISSIYLIYDFLIESRDRRRIHKMFGQYVPLEHINKLIENPKELTTDGEKREMTVLFSDIRNFTSLSEHLSTHELKSFFKLYLTPITKIIFQHQGTIDKYVGDMVMAFWGAPLRNPQHASLAITAALKIQNKISQMQKKFKKLGLHQVTAGIGIHTGEMNVGDMGSDYRRAYTVLGDAVNLGSRLEGLTKYYEVKILTSEETKKQCPNMIFRYIDFVRVKGKQDAIRIYEPIALSIKDLNKRQVKLLKQHNKAFDEYLSKEWKKARQCFKSLYQETKDPLYKLYIERIEQQENSIDTWDGIYVHGHK